MCIFDSFQLSRIICETFRSFVADFKGYTADSSYTGDFLIIDKFFDIAAAVRSVGNNCQLMLRY